LVLHNCFALKIGDILYIWFQNNNPSVNEKILIHICVLHVVWKKFNIVNIPYSTKCHWNCFFSSLQRLEEQCMYSEFTKQSNIFNEIHCNNHICKSNLILLVMNVIYNMYLSIMQFLSFFYFCAWLFLLSFLKEILFLKCAHSTSPTTLNNWIQH